MRWMALMIPLALGTNPVENTPFEFPGFDQAISEHDSVVFAPQDMPVHAEPAAWTGEDHLFAEVALVVDPVPVMQVVGARKRRFEEESDSEDDQSPGRKLRRRFSVPVAVPISDDDEPIFVQIH